MEKRKIFNEGLSLNHSEGFTRQNFLRKISGGFTLLELLVVVAIIAILTAVVLASLTTARNKGSDAAVKADLRNALNQAEIFNGTNTVAPNSYTSVCTNGIVGGANGIGSFILNAAKDSSLASYTLDGTGSTTTATCNDSANSWAAEVPLKYSTGLWCVDSTGRSKQEATSILAGTVCP